MAINTTDLLHPPVSQELLAQMQQDRQDELKAKAEFEAEKARLKAMQSMNNNSQESQTHEPRSQTNEPRSQTNEPKDNTAPKSNEEAKEALEEMTLGELGMEIPDLVRPTDGRTVPLLNGSTKINEKLESIKTPLFSALSTLVIYASRMELRGTIAQDYGSAYNKVFEFALRLIKTAKHKDKRGCNLNATTDNYKTALKEVIALSIQHPVRTKAVVLMEALIAEGVKINTFELSVVQQRLKDQVPFDPLISLGEYYSLAKFLTPLDKILEASGKAMYDSNIRYDCYAISKWDFAQDIPSSLKTPAFKVLFKAIYQQNLFVVDRPDMTPEQLISLIKEQNENNAFPHGINGIIISYICPEILDLQTLSCFKRSPKFYQNILYIGKQFFEEDLKKEVEQLALQQSKESQQVHQVQQLQATTEQQVQAATNGANLSLTPMYSTSLQQVETDESTDERRFQKRQLKIASI